MGVIELLLDGLGAILTAVADFVGLLNPCPFEGGFDLSGFAPAGMVLGWFVDLQAIAGITVAWAASLGVAWVVMLAWRWFRAVE